jgi:hypothetical protein
MASWTNQGFTRNYSRDEYHVIYKDIAKSTRIVSSPTEIVGEALYLIANGWVGELWLFPPRGEHEAANLALLDFLGVPYLLINLDGSTTKHGKLPKTPTKTTELRQNVANQLGIIPAAEIIRPYLH